jgi:cell division protein FtsL
MLEVLFYWISKLLVLLFFIGLFGSAIVILITFYEDAQLLFERDKTPKGTSSIAESDTGSSPRREPR